MFLARTVLQSEPGGIPLLGYGDSVNDDDHSEGDGQPAVGLPNQLIPGQMAPLPSSKGTTHARTLQPNLRKVPSA